MENLARWLLDFEASAVDIPGEKSKNIFAVCDKLRLHLSVQMAAAGFRSLLFRAVALATEEVPRLEAIRIGEDGSLEWAAGKDPLGNGRETAEGAVALLTQLLGLLVVFVGGPLTLLLVREIWPGTPSGWTDSRTEEGI